MARRIGPDRGAIVRMHFLINAQSESNRIEIMGVRRQKLERGAGLLGEGADHAGLVGGQLTALAQAGGGASSSPESVSKTYFQGFGTRPLTTRAK